ncbi:MAG TPA: type II toxin-antitoxin system RelE/ParE family toxin [Steroidobacteraceae bacterium]
MARLRVRKVARADIDAAFAWYRQHSPAAAQRFLDAVDVAFALIDEAPERYPLVRGRLRRVLLRQFPYAVYYKVYPTVVSIVGVIHGHRHPNVWLRRG